MAETVRDLHHRAMRVMDDADAHRRRDALGIARVKYKTAADLEARAAALVPIGPESEPTRGILYRSAAWLAVNATDYDMALCMAEEGLKGTPPSDVREELLEVQKTARKAKKRKGRK